MTTPNGTGITNRGTNYADGSQVTSGNLKEHVDNAVFNNNAVDGVTLGLNASSPKALFVNNQGIDTAQLKDNAVTTAKITDANVTTTKIADSNVTTNKIADDAVTGAKISDTAALPDGVTATTQSADDNSEKVATTAYADTAAESTGVKVATYELASVGITSTRTAQLAEQADPNNIATVSSGVISIGAGTYLVRFYGFYDFQQGDLRVDYKINSTVIATHTLTNDSDNNNFAKDYIHVNASGTDTVQIDLFEITPFTNVTGKNLGITIMKIG